MRSVGLAAACMGVMSMLLMAPQAQAAPAKCGQPGANGQPVTGELSLVKDTSTPDLKFGPSGDTDKFILYLKVSGCALRSADDVDASVDVSQPAQKAIGEPKKVLQGSGQLKIEIPVNPTFPTKQYKPVLTLSSANDIVSTTQVALTMDRKEKPAAPSLIALVAFVLGTWWAFRLAATTAGDKLKEDERVTFNSKHLLTAVVGALIGSMPVFVTTYVTPDAWSLGLGSAIALFIAVISAAAGGATAGAGTAYVVSKKKQQKEAKQAA